MCGSLKYEELLRLDKLLVAINEGILSPEDAAQLKKLVVNNPAALWRYTQATHLFAGLMWEKGGVANPLEGTIQDKAVRKVPFSLFTPVRGVTNLFARHAWLARAAVLLIFGTGVLWATGTIHPFGPKQVKVADVPLATLTPIAQVVSISPDCQWATAEGQLSNGQLLEADQQIRFNSGQVKLHFNQGARVTLNGPAAFVVATANSGHLILGGLTAQIPESARGYFVDTPYGKVVDYGTEFGVVIDDFGSTEVGVFKGKIVAYACQADGPVTLNAGSSFLWDSNSSRHSAVSMRRFDQGTTYTSFVNEEIQSVKLVLADDFDDQILNTDQWKTLGHVTETGGGLQLGRGIVGDEGNVPYLLTTRQFDPSEGTVVITGTVRFSEPLQHYSGALSVFTRAENQRGTFPRPEYAYLGTGVRNTFWPVSTVAGETLRILVRPLPGADNVGILGEEFEASGDSSEWRFQVVDDGVNLMLSIAQLDNPVVMKTVYARSLFPGKANFIAFEGDPNAAIVLDNVRIFQIDENPDSNSHSVLHNRFNNRDRRSSSLDSLLAQLH